MKTTSTALVSTSDTAFTAGRIAHDAAVKTLFNTSDRELTRSDLRNITTDEFAVGLKLFRLDASFSGGMLDPDQPAFYYGEIVALSDGTVSIEFSDGHVFTHTYRGSKTYWYVRGIDRNPGIALSDEKADRWNLLIALAEFALATEHPAARAYTRAVSSIRQSWHIAGKLPGRTGSQVECNLYVCPVCGEVYENDYDEERICWECLHATPADRDDRDDEPDCYDEDTLRMYAYSLHRRQAALEEWADTYEFDR